MPIIEDVVNLGLSDRAAQKMATTYETHGGP